MANRFTTATLEDDGENQEWDGEDWKYMVKSANGTIMCVCDDLHTAHVIGKLLSAQEEAENK